MAVQQPSLGDGGEGQLCASCWPSTTHEASPPCSTGKNRCKIRFYNIIL